MNIEQYKKMLREFGCVVTRNPACELHHLLGGSVNDIMRPEDRPSTARKINDWFQIPLHPTFHTGDQGIHKIGVQTWETKYGEQSQWLLWLMKQTGVDVWEMSGLTPWNAEGEDDETSDFYDARSAAIERMRIFGGYQ